MIKINAYAKINLTLEVAGKRPDGFHELRSVMHQLRMHDEVMVESLNDNTITVECDKGVPADKSNTAHMAAELMKKKFNVNKGAKIAIKKHIPVAAGLSGGSTDAAAVIKALNMLWKLGLSQEEQMKLGEQIGADVPFAVMGGTAVAKGKGELLDKINTRKALDFIIINPGFEVLTKDVYGRLDIKKCSRKDRTSRMKRAIEDGNIKEIAANLCNDLESVVLPEYSIIEEIKASLVKQGALNALMSGSGATVFGLFENDAKAEEAYKKLRMRYSFVELTGSR